MRPWNRTFQMKFCSIYIVLFSIFIGGFNGTVQGSSWPYADETPAQRDGRMAWWREARFGMFIHWGVYAVPAGTYKGNRIDGIGEWIMLRGQIPVADCSCLLNVGPVYDEGV